MRAAAAAVAALLLSACTAQQQSDALVCAAALQQSGARSVDELFRVAMATPACVTLGMDVLQRLVAEAAAKRGLR